MIPSPDDTVEARATERARWFAAEVQPYHSSLRAYVRAAFPTLSDAEDVVQESFFRLWRLKTAIQVRSAKAFLFTVARNIALDTVRRARISPVFAVPDLSALSVIEEGTDVRGAASHTEDVALLAEALQSLPPRCREIIILRKFQNLPQKEVAARLGISELTVQEQVYRGLRRLEKILTKRGLIRRWSP